MMPVSEHDGFTLIELLTALLILSLLALLSYRGLSTVLDARQQIREESEKWRRVGTFFARFERDIQLAAPRPVRTNSGEAPAWLGTNSPGRKSHLEFSRMASTEGVDVARRLAYGLNEKQEIELLLWPGLDIAPDATPERHAVLSKVVQMELRYLNAQLVWMDGWPLSPDGPVMPQAVSLSIVLASGERITRVFSLKS